MKKIIFTLLALIIAITASAIPADPTPTTVTQPNGETLQLLLTGDEFYHYNTTIDGYTVLNVKDCWEYATLDGRQLVTTGVQAHDPEARSAKEQQLLAATTKHLVDKQKSNSALKARSSRNQKAPRYDYDNFRALVVLINFNDREFQMDDANDFYNQMFNAENYEGFDHEWGFQECTGSVRDYYYDNSMGMFDPEFDIVGPINVDFASVDCEGNDNADKIFIAALNAIDSQVDFSIYDGNNDGIVDMIFFVVAGYGSYWSGNNSNYLWPYSSLLYETYEDDMTNHYLQYDGKYVLRYACSCELYGYENSSYILPCGISIVVHESNHVLGLPDLYDTDGSGSGGNSQTPGAWDVMDGGHTKNYYRTPVGLSLWERWKLGFTEQPEELSLGSKSLTALDISNTGYMMSSPNFAECFFFENRQNDKWDSALPGHGLVVTRVDESNQQVWWRNKVNCDPSHNYYKIVDILGETSSYNEINSITEPPLLTWDGETCQYGLSDIIEDNGIITFNVIPDVIPKDITEDFESMTEGYTGTTDKLGCFATWTFVQASKVEGGSSNGNYAAALKMPGGITMTSDLAIKPFKVTLNAYNAAATASNVHLYYSTDEGATWNSLGINPAPGKTTTQLIWHVPLHDPQPIRFRINRTTGSKNVNLIIDDITIHYCDSILYDMTVAGTQVSGVNMGNLAQIDGVEGLAQYYPISGNLKLNAATITTDGDYGINYCEPQKLNINVAAENSLNKGLSIETGVEAHITGNGSFNVSGSEAGISTTDPLLTIDGGVNLTAQGSVYGISGSNTTLAIGGTNTVANIKGEELYPLTGINSLNLLDGLLITKPSGAYFDDGHIYLSDGTIAKSKWLIISNQPSATPGDVNGDGIVTSADVTAIYDYLLMSDSSHLVDGDQNEDGNITAADITAVYNIFLGNK